MSLSLVDVPAEDGAIIGVRWPNKQWPRCASNMTAFFVYRVGSSNWTFLMVDVTQKQPTLAVIKHLKYDGTFFIRGVIGCSSPDHVVKELSTTLMKGDRALDANSRKGKQRSSPFYRRNLFLTIHNNSIAYLILFLTSVPSL